jgi:LysR family glycine cleavage system transcriptional activator
MDWSNLPPLTALRSFEATARHGSFSAAAREQNVTPAAINQQVRALERHLNASLVQRQGRGVALTEAGNSLARDLSQAFTTIRDGVERVAEASAARPVRITTTPTFAAYWFMPRYGAFRAKYPDLELMVHPTGAVIDMTDGTYDFAIRFNGKQTPGLESVPLVATPIVVVGTPDLIASTPYEGLEALGHLPWFVESGSDEMSTWQAAFRQMAARPDNVTWLPGTMILEAVREGHGVATVAEMFVADDIAAGRLVPIWRTEEVAAGYSLIHRSGVLRPAAKAFATWIKREASGG